MDSKWEWLVGNDTSVQKPTLKGDRWELSYSLFGVITEMPKTG